MIVRYTRQALADLDEARGHIAQERPAAAQAIAQSVQKAIARLELFPESGRTGRVAGTRELVIHGTPFIAVYRVRAGHADVLAIMHGSRQWPTAFGG